MAGGGEFLPEFEVVIDLAVEDDPERPVLVCHRLPTFVGEVEDCKTAVSEADRTGEETPLAVGTAVEEPLCHGPDKVRVRFSPVQGKLPGNAAHAPTTYPGGSYQGPSR